MQFADLLIEADGWTRFSEQRQVLQRRDARGFVERERRRLESAPAAVLPLGT